ncbi:MAG TPA: alpha/beta hydrolase [Nevskiaceae bacterium]|nr:alpha/beta hydrolase [Nevskiaceae bacterium]
MLRKILLASACLLASCSTQQMLNTVTPENGYDVASNLIYDAEHNLRADIYTPTAAVGAPVVVYFGGLRWSEGDKADYKFVGQALASRGFVCVIPNVREYPQVRFPAFVQDGANAIKWTRQHVGLYGGDLEKLIIMGHSSGAHIAAMLALDEEWLKAVGGSRAWLRGMIGLAGPYDFLPLTDPDLRDIFGPPEDFEKGQPIFYVDGQNPPLLLIHGEDDDSVLVKNSINLADAVRHAGGAVETVIYPKLSHRFALITMSAPLRGQSDVLDNVTDFIKRVAVARALNNEVQGVETQAAPPPAPLPPPTQMLPPPPAADAPTPVQ